MTERREMRVLITGVDGDGRSCVVGEQVGLDPTPDGLFHFGVVHRTVSAPPPSRPPGRADHMDVQVPAGIVQWIVVDYEPNAVQENHHTDTIDFNHVLEGTVELVLDDGVHPLHAGDGVVVNGVDHAWKAGPGGCRLSVLFLGTPTRDD